MIGRALGRIGQRVGLLLALALVIGIVCQFATNLFWFAEVGYTEVLWLRLLTQGGIWAIVSSISALFLLGNLALAARFKDAKTLEPALTDAQRREVPSSKQRLSEASRSPAWRLANSDPKPPGRKPLLLRWLLPGVLGLILLISLLLLQHVQVGTTAWQSTTNQLNGLPPLPDRIRLDGIWQHGREILSLAAFSPATYLRAGLVIVFAIAVLLYPSVLLGAIAIGESLGLGFILSAQWGRFLQCFHAIPFGQTEPLFAHDISVYVFALPIAELLTFWLFDLFLFGLLAVALVYLLADNSLSQGFFVGFSRPQRQHLSTLGGCFMLATGLHYWLSRYELLYSTRGATYGAGYTDVTVLLPAYTVLSLLAGAIVIVLFWEAFGQKAEGRRQKAEGRISSKPDSNALSSTPHYRSAERCSAERSRRSLLPTPFLLLICYLAIAFTLTTVLPNLFQRLLVQPNELALEQPYIRRSIALTQAAFALDKIEVKPFNPQANLTFETLLANQETTRNIRLWDTRPLLETNRQLQQIRPYYRFFDADIDRYTFGSEGRGERGEERSQESGFDVSAQPNSAQPNGVRSQASQSVSRTELGVKMAESTSEAEGNLSEESRGTRFIAKTALEKQQVLIAARELDYTAVPKEAQTWINEHLVYTHGYGFTLSPVNEVADGGLPNYYVKDIGASTAPIDRKLSPVDASLRASIPTANPRLYYGELSNTYVMTGTQVQELDYPSGSSNAYNVYDGSGGIRVGSFWRRCLLAGYLRDWRMLLTTDFTPQTKVLFRRNINDRIRTIAPFLQFDHDPYLVVADVGGETGGRRENKGKTQNYLYWMVDAYTTSDRYPYADPGQFTSVSGVNATPRGEKFNYIRNSVKVVIDAYSGAVDFYIANPTDPLIQAWAATFPTLLKPLSQMPAALRSHLRYPADLFSVQSERLQLYHMTDPQVFYNREDLWQVPTEIYGDQPQLVEPYYLITKLANAKNGAGDPAKDEEFILLLPYTPDRRTNLTAWLAARSDGENYGKSLLYVFPKQQLVYGTQQIEARINQDPVISQQISLWNRAGSRAIQGNLLVIPIEQSLLYVEPLYLQAEQNSLPTLVRVIVAYENRIAMAETLDQALRAVFQPKEQVPAIVRPVE